MVAGACTPAGFNEFRLAFTILYAMICFANAVMRKYEDPSFVKLDLAQGIVDVGVFRARPSYRNPALVRTRVDLVNQDRCITKLTRSRRDGPSLESL